MKQEMLSKSFDKTSKPMENTSPMTAEEYFNINAEETNKWLKKLTKTERNHLVEILNDYATHRLQFERKQFEKIKQSSQLLITEWLLDKCQRVQRGRFNLSDYIVTTKWCLIDDAVNLWDGFNDSQLKLYSSEEIIEYHEKHFPISHPLTEEK